MTETDRVVVAHGDDPTTEMQVRHSTAHQLHSIVIAMNPDNFVVRPHRRIIEKYASPEVWTKLSPDALTELAHEVAGLPAEIEAEDEEAKRFDYLVLSLQLALLRAEPWFERLSHRVKDIAGLLEEKAAIPMVNAQMELILEVQSDEWWQNVTIPMLERARRRLRDLVKFIEKRKRKPIYTDFEDEMGAETTMQLPGLRDGTDYAKFKAKARAFLRQHQDHIAIRKLRMNTPLTQSDLAELERMFLESGVGAAEDIERAKSESEGLGLFVRSLIGLDRGAAKQAVAGFLSGNSFTANQIEFVDMIADHLTEHGAMDPSLLYESPFTDLTPKGPDGLFTSMQIDKLIGLLNRVKATALVA